MMNSSSKVIKLQKQVTHIAAVNSKLVNYLNDDELNKIIDEKISRAKEKAFKEGYLKGSQEASASEKKKFAASAQTLSQTLDGLNEYIASIHKEIESEVVSLAFFISETIVRHELSHPEAVSKIIKDAINKIYAPRSIIVKLHPQSGPYFDQIIAELKNRNVDLTQLKVEIDQSVGQGGCYIETNNSVVDARIDKIIDEVRQRIQELIRWEIPTAQE